MPLLRFGNGNLIITFRQRLQCLLIKLNGSGVTEAHFAEVSEEDRVFLKIIVSVCSQEPVTEYYTNMYMVHPSKDENSNLIKNEIILQKCSTIIINSGAFSFKYSGTNLGYPVMSVFCKLLEVSPKLVWRVDFVFALVMGQDVQSVICLVVRCGTRTLQQKSMVTVRTS